jgi:hypothetical protein
VRVVLNAHNKMFTVPVAVTLEVRRIIRKHKKTYKCFTRTLIITFIIKCYYFSIISLFSLSTLLGRARKKAFHCPSKTCC